MLGESLAPPEAVSFNWDCVSVFDFVKAPALLVSLVLLLLAIGNPFFARPKRDQQPVTERTGLFKIPVWIRNGSAGFQTDLRQQDFQVLGSNVHLELSTFLKPESPTLLFLAFDTVGEI